MEDEDDKYLKGIMQQAKERKVQEKKDAVRREHEEKENEKRRQEKIKYLLHLKKQAALLD